jgi:hypothetical protein
MKFKTRITLRDYIKLMYVLTYKKGWMIFVTILGILMLCIAIIYLTGSIPILFGKDYTPWTNIMLGLLFLAVIPVTVYFSA